MKKGGRFSLNKFLTLCFLIIIFSSGLVLAHEGVIKSASELDYPPYSIVAEDGSADGFSVELLRASLKAVDLDVSFYVGPWSEVKEDLAEGRIQVLPVVGRTPEREPIYDFTIPYLTFHGAIFLREGDDRIKGVEDLVDKEVLVMEGDNSEEYVKRENVSQHIITTKSFDEAFELLAEGKHDVIIAQKLMGTNILNKLGINNVVAGPRLEEFKQEFTFAVREGDEELLLHLNEGLSIAIADGALEELYLKWFGQPLYPEKIKEIEEVIIEERIPEWIFPTLVIMLIIVLTLLFMERKKIFISGLEKTKKSSISKKIFISFTLVSLVLSSVGIYTFYIFSTNSIEQELFSHLETAAHSRASHTKYYLDSNLDKLRLVSSRTKLRLSLENYNKNPNEEDKALMKKIMLDALTSDEHFISICIIGLDGKVIVSTISEFEDKDCSDRPFFIGGKSGEGIALFVDERENPMISLYGPLVIDGLLLGVISIRVNPDELHSLLTERTGWGETGETYLVNSEYMMVSPSRFIENAVLKQKVDTINVKNCFSMRYQENLKGYGLVREHGEHKAISEFLDYRGTKVVGTHVYISGVDWCMLAEIDKSEALDAPKRKLVIAGILIVLAVFLSIVLISYIISRKISKPINELTVATEKLEKGDFGARVDIRTGDELEQLGNAFNRTIEALALMQEEQKQLDKAKTEFLSITSHELRSPMTPMKAQLQMVMGEYFGKLSQKQKDALEIVLRNTTRLDNIIQDFLEISRIEAARLKFNFKKTDLTKHIESVVEEMKGFLPEKKIQINVKISKLSTIEVDPDRVMQVFRNLLNNAKKFSKQNGKIIVDVMVKEGKILFKVQDDGIGISKENQKRIFEPFFQGEQTMYRQYGGTGLGLAICRGIIESQGGKVWVESEKGKGSTFYFTVPFNPIKETKPIKLLFSQKADVEKQIAILFNEVLGPIGGAEYQGLKKKGEITKENLFKYIDLLSGKGILNKEKVKEFKRAILFLLEGKGERRIDSSKLKEAGLIKSESKKKLLRQKLKDIYVEMLGSEGIKEFNKLKGELDTNEIIKQIDSLKSQSKLTSRKSKDFKERVKSLLK